MQEIYSSIRKMKNENVPIEQIVSNMLQEMGIHQNLSGFYYTRFAVIYLYNSGKTNMAQVHITKDLYPLIAQEFKTTVSGVERSIRHVISHSNRVGMMDSIFPYLEVSSNKCKGPTNSEFLCTLADIISIA